MKLIVGLGNSRSRYESTRHNAGFVVVDELANKITSAQWQMTVKFNSLVNNHQKSVIIAKPQTMMNSSGLAVSSLTNFYKISISDVYVIHDDLDIQLGEFKIQKGKGPREHNGLNSIYQELGTKDFWHVRVGVENEETRKTSQGKRISGEDYVLMNFTDNEFDVLSTVVKDIVDELSKMIL